MKEPYDIFVVATPGLEPALASELADLGLGGGVATAGGVELRATLAEAMRANLWSRVATRVLLRVAEFPAPSFPALVEGCAAAEWGRFLLPGRQIRVSVSVHRSRIGHAGHAERSVVTGIKRGREESGFALATPSAEPQLVQARIVDNRCVLSVDMSGELLHRRGYRLETSRASLRETLAAGILRLAEWQPGTPLVDPMCGAGTFLLEGALRAAGRAPGAARSFAFEQWPMAPPETWRRVQSEPGPDPVDIPEAPFVGRDRSSDAVAAATHNAERAGIGTQLDLAVGTLAELSRPGEAPGLVVCNPPYGKRIGSRSALRRVYAELGHVLASRFRGYKAAILCPDRRLEKDLRLLVTARHPLVNGGVHVDLLIAAL